MTRAPSGTHGSWDSATVRRASCALDWPAQMDTVTEVSDLLNGTLKRLFWGATARTALLAQLRTASGTASRPASASALCSGLTLCWSARAMTRKDLGLSRSSMSTTRTRPSIYDDNPPLNTPFISRCSARSHVPRCAASPHTPTFGSIVASLRHCMCARLARLVGSGRRLAPAPARASPGPRVRPCRSDFAASY